MPSADSHPVWCDRDRCRAYASDLTVLTTHKSEPVELRHARSTAAVWAEQPRDATGPAVMVQAGYAGLSSAAGLSPDVALRFGLAVVRQALLAGAVLAAEDADVLDRAALPRRRRARAA